MILENRYNIPEQTVKRMINDGVIKSAWNTCDEITKMKREGKTWDEISFKTKMSIRNAKYIYKMGQ